MLEERRAGKDGHMSRAREYPHMSVRINDTKGSHMYGCQTQDMGL